jgi:hypothetical protein
MLKQTTTTNYNYLNFVRFQTLIDGWSANSLLGMQLLFNKKYPLHKIGVFMKRNKTEAKIKDDIIYKRVKVKLYTKGVTLRRNWSKH